MYRAAISIETDAIADLEHAITREFAGKIALVSSFGTESAVLLHMVARIDPRLPVLFLDTARLFPDTIAYRDALVSRLRLSDVRTIRPDPKHLAQYDPAGRLFAADPDLCCALRKTMPLDTALEPFDAWISGRKRGQSETRRDITDREIGPDGRTIFNPLHDWSRGDVTAYFDTHALPRHPLEATGFGSIGCFSCTARSDPNTHPRAGRWYGLGKTECGIFLNRLSIPGDVEAAR